MRYMRYFDGVKLKSGRFTKLNGRAICLGILCVLFIPFAVFAQSQSSTETIIEKVFQSEIRVREHVDTKVAGIETKVDNLTTKVETFSKDVTENKTNIGNMKEDIRDLKGAVDRIWYGILGVLGTLILSIVGYFVKSWREGQGKADSVDVVDRFTEQITKLTSAQAEQIDKLTSAQTEAQAETSAQISRLISEISATRGVPRDPKAPSAEGLGEVTDDIRSTDHDVERTV